MKPSCCAGVDCRAQRFGTCRLTEIAASLRRAGEHAAKSGVEDAIPAAQPISRFLLVPPASFPGFVSSPRRGILRFRVEFRAERSGPGGASSLRSEMTHYVEPPWEEFVARIASLADVNTD